MKFAWFPGCKIPFHLEHYGTSSKAVLAELGVQLEEPEFNCCGYPIRNLDFNSHILSAARNFALAEKIGLNILTPCKCCYGNLKHARYALANNPKLAEDVNRDLSEEGLRFRGKAEIFHLLPVLARDIGVDRIKEKIRRTFKDLRIAAHYGCHALRPSNITVFDNPLAPSLFEKLIAITGAETVDWTRRLDCCGNPILSRNHDMSIRLMNRKIESALESGADYLCSACTYCQIQFDAVQNAETPAGSAGPRLPSILYPQLLGLCLNIQEKKLGLDQNLIDISGIGKHLDR